MYMYEIFQEAEAYIDYELGILNNLFESKSFDQRYGLACLEEVVDDLKTHRVHIEKYCSDFSCQFDADADRYLKEILDVLEEARNLFADKSYDLESIKEKIYYALFLYTGKYLDYLSGWRDFLTVEGLCLTARVVIYIFPDLQEVFLQTMINALQAERLFFSISRNKNSKILALKNDFLFNRTTETKTRVIQAAGISARTLITANVAAVEESLREVDLMQLRDQSSIATLTKWHRKSGMNWNREKVSTGILEINYQFQPVVGQLANIYVKGIGSYGAEKESDVLSVFNVLTQKNPHKEQILARILLQYKYGKGEVLNEVNLIASDMQLHRLAKDRKVLLDRFRRAAHLVCFLETPRRKNQGYEKINGVWQKTPDLPFGVAISCALKLIADGHLMMKDVFEHNALYGVFSGTAIMKSDNLSDTIKKFNALFAFFTNCYAEKLYEVFDYAEGRETGLNVVFTAEYFHQFLKITDDGGYDSDNEEYPCDNDESRAEALRGYLPQSDLKPFTLHL